MEASAFTIFLLYYSFVAADGSPIVNITNWGMARGYQYNLLGKPVNVFLGIPFARPPTHNLRFAPPDIRPKPWSNIKNFTKPSAMCIQPRNPEINAIKAVLSEDCLYLSIYAPGNATSSSRFAVMVWIHGGAYSHGSGILSDGAMLATQHQLIVVTINYRLGVLGFFNAPGTSATGNYGLLDQIAALKWVKSNIEQFGGDPELVTIFGESAGSTSVSLHLLSSLSKGLFKRAISQSGTANIGWAISPPGVTDSYAKSFGASIGCNDLNKLLECLRSKSSEDILSHQTTFTPIAVPNVDNHFLKARPAELIVKNKLNELPLNNVDYLLGFNLNEGTWQLPPNISKKQFEKAVMDQTKMSYPGKNLEKLNAAIFYKYTDWAADDKTPLRWFKSQAEFLTDFIFKVPIIEFTNAWIKTNKTAYVYQFSHAAKFLKVPRWGVAHASELSFVFGSPYYPPKHPGGIGIFTSNFTEADRNVSRNMMELWAGFAKTGSPGLGWPKYSLVDKEYLNIALQNEVKEKLEARCNGILE